MADRATHPRERSASVEEAYKRHTYDEYRALLHRLQALRVPPDEHDEWLKRVAEYDDLLTTVPTSLPFKKYKTLEHATAFCIWSLLSDEWQEHFWLVLTDAAAHAQPELENLHPARDDEIVQQIQDDLRKKYFLTAGLSPPQ
ncbi:hypothetical protein Rhopal_007656-T1 [Rhodotorula paludigena]|uniref:Uncharacterized protein n=1 Tax=Rhodotorula paludigena TaxID=86838 RepID=A0AAV5GWA3_9BASI|nr:hypothetical protein Rhopal_007656-T1 [Rhodotorula paludigena]